MKRLYILTVFIVIAASAVQSTAQTSDTRMRDLETRIVAEDLDAPWELFWGPDNWLWITERDGKISRINPKDDTKEVLLTVPGTLAFEGESIGSVILHPKFVDSPYVYIRYNVIEGAGIEEHYVRYTYKKDGLIDETPMEEWVEFMPTILGFDLYNHPAIPQWQGSFLSTVMDETSLVQMRFNATQDSVVFSENYYHYEFGNLQDVCVSPDGKVYIVTNNRNKPTIEGFPQKGDDKIIELSNPYYSCPLPCNDNIKVFPNPVGNYLTLQYSWHLKNSRFDLVNALGEIVQTGMLNPRRSHSIYRNDLPSGMYYLRIYAANYQFTKQVVFQ